MSDGRKGSENTEVAQRQAAEARLRESEARFRAVQEASPYGLVLLRPEREHGTAGQAGSGGAGRIIDFHIQYANSAGARLTGKNAEAMVGRGLTELFPATRELGLFDAYVGVVETGKPWQDDVRYNGDGLAAGYQLAAVRVGDGDTAEVLLLYADATARLAMEAERSQLLAELDAERERLRSVILHTPAPLALLEGPAHRFALVNDAYKRISGGGRDVTGLTPQEAFPELAGSGIYELFDQVYATGEPWDGPETPVRYDRDGNGVEDTWFNLRFEPVRNARGQVTGVLNFSVDVTEQVRARHAAERLLVDSESARRDAESASARAEAVLASIADAFYLLNRDWRFTYVNDAAEPLLQSTRDALLGRTLWDAFPGVIGSPFEGPYREAMATGRVTSAEAYFPPLDTWFDVRTYPWTGGLMVHFRDIGERKAADAEREGLLQALEVERSRLAAVFAQTPSVLAIVRGPQHVLEMANAAYIALNGNRDVIGKPLLEAIPELRDQGFDKLLDQVVTTGESYVGREVPIRLSTAPGAAPEERFFDFVYLPLVEPDATGAGLRVGVIAHGNDITEQVRARQEVERARERADRLQAMTAALAATATPDEVARVVVAQGVAATGATTGMLAFPVTSRKSGQSGEAEIRQYHTVSPSVAEANARFPLPQDGPVAECLRSGAVIFIEDGAALRDRFPDVAPTFDSMGTQAMAAVPLTAAGNVIGALSFAWSAPRPLPQEDRELFLALGQQAAQALERARLFEAERAARAEAEAANRAKSEFLAVMSHELRTPLNAIGGYAELMEMGIRGPVTPLQQEDLRRVQASQRHLLGLINEVLNYAKLETGTVHFDVVPTLLRDTLAEAEALVAPQARAKGLTLTTVLCAPDLAAQADPEKLRQVLVNLLSNAVKFTAAGGHVTLACVDAGEHAHVTVQDTGIGIPADQQERIFDPFVQVRSDLTRPHEGTGLGLAISRDLARGMGGNLSVESTPGGGSTFTLTLTRA